MANWNPEGSFYEQQSGQGEDQWADGAQFDTLDAPTVDLKFSVTPVSWGALTADASGKVPTPGPYGTS